MSVTLVVNGTGYSFPNTGDESWGDNVTNWATAVTSSMLQKTGGTFTLSADVDFGSSFGLKSVYYKSRATNPATTGQVRLGTAEVIAWRNNANSGNLPLTTDASDNLTWNGVILASSSGVVPVASGGTGITSYTAGDMIYASAGTTLAKLAIGSANKVLFSNGSVPGWQLLLNANIDPAAAIAMSKLAALTASRVLVSDGSGVVSVSSVTSTTLGFLDATSSVQTQLDAKVLKSTYSAKGSILVATAAATPANLSVGSDGQVPVADSSQSSGVKWATLQQGAKNYITYNNFENNATTGWSLANSALSSNIPTTVMSAATAYAGAYYVFTVTSANATAAATYTNNAQTFTVVATIAAGTILVCTGTGSPLASGTLTKSAGTGDATITFSAFKLTTASGNLSISTVSSGQLAGTYSLSLASSAATTAGDMLISQAYTIDTEDQAKAIFGQFYYKAQTNPSNANWSGTSSNSFAAYIYDVTNAQWIQPAGVYNIVQSSGVGICKFVWQTPSNMTQFQVAFLFPNATSGAVTVYLDDFSVGPQPLLQGPVVTDWGAQSWTPTGTWSSNTTYTGKWRRVGDSLHARVKVSLSGAPTSTSLQINLPSGMSIDTSKCANGTGNQYEDILGDANLRDSGVTLWRGYVVYDTSTTVRIVGTIASGDARNNDVTQAAPATWGAADTMNIEFIVPISGWSSNAQMSNDTDTRVVGASAYGNPASATSGNPFIFPTKEFDTHSAYDTSTGRFTCPVSGYYEMTFTGVMAAGTALSVYPYKNAVQGQILTSCSTTDIGISGVTILSCVAGDILDFRPNNTLDLSGGFITFKRLSGPSVVAATESVNCRYSNTAGTTLTKSAANTVPFATKDYDSHGAFVTDTFTVPVSGKYSVKSMVTIATGATWAANDVIIMGVLKNGSTHTQGNVVLLFGTTTAAISASVTATVNCLAGDTIKINCQPNKAAASNVTLDTTAGYNTVAIERVGN